MKKIIKKVGGSIGIYFNREESIAYNLGIGDIIDIEICKINTTIKTAEELEKEENKECLPQES